LPGEKLTGQVDGAEIDNLLLEKIEESHLYILELKQEKDAEIQELSDLNTEQQSQITILQTELCAKDNTYSFC